MSYTRYTFLVSTAGGVSAGAAVKNFVHSLIATVPNLSLYDEPTDTDNTYEAIIRITNTDYCYMNVYLRPSSSSRYLKLSWGTGSTVQNGSNDGDSLVNTTGLTVEVVNSDGVLIFRKGSKLPFWFGHITSAVDQSSHEFYGWSNSSGSPTVRHPVSDSAAEQFSFTIPAIGSNQASALDSGEYYLGEGVLYGNTANTIKAPYLINGNGPYFMNGNPEPSIGVYDDHRGNAFYHCGYNNFAMRL